MRIAHFADLHINTSVRDSNITETIALFEHALENGAEHFFLTGDLSHNAEAEDFEALRHILEYFNLLDPQKASIVIGNHDIFGGPQKAEDIFTFPQRCKEVDYDNKVEIFNSYFEELFTDCMYKPEGKVYPYAKIIRNNLIVGLNSIDKYSSMKNPFASNGLIDEEQFSELEIILSELGDRVKNRFILIHHHFNKLKSPSTNMMHYFWQALEKQTMKLKQKKELFDLFTKHKIDMVFHGHIHEMNNYSRKGIKFVNSGGGFGNLKKGELFYNRIDVTKKGVTSEAISFPYLKKKKKYLRQYAGVSDIII